MIWLNNLISNKNSDNQQSAATYPQFFEKLERLGYSPISGQHVLDYVQVKAPIVINLAADAGWPIAESGQIKSSWETRTTGSSHLPKLNSPRDCKEKLLFHCPNDYSALALQKRPRYGSLNFKKSRFAAKSYGSVMIQLKKHVRSQCTLTPFDSLVSYCCPEHVGDFTNIEPVLLELSPEKLKILVNRAELKSPTKPVFVKDDDDDDNGDDNGDDYTYIEVQIHQKISLKKDVEKIILPRQNNYYIEVEPWEQIAQKNNIYLTWRGTLVQSSFMRINTVKDIINKFNWKIKMAILDSSSFDKGKDYFSFLPTQQKNREQSQGSYLCIAHTIDSTQILLNHCDLKNYDIVGYSLSVGENKQQMLIYRSNNVSKSNNLNSKIHQIGIDELADFVKLMNQEKQTIKCLHAPSESSHQTANYNVQAITQQYPQKNFKTAQLQQTDEEILDNALAVLKHQKLCAIAGLKLSCFFLFVVNQIS